MRYNYFEMLSNIPCNKFVRFCYNKTIVTFSAWKKKMLKTVWLNWSRIHVETNINMQAANCFYSGLSLGECPALVFVLKLK